MLTILGWLWHDPNCLAQYTPEHASVWARMIHRNLSLPHRFVLATDTPDAEFDPLITPIPLWDDWREVRNPSWPKQKPHCYVRLKAFSDKMRDVLGDRFVSVDLDCLVLDNASYYGGADKVPAGAPALLDPLFNRNEDFVIYHRPVVNGARERNKYQGSMWMMNTGARRQVFDDFEGLRSIDLAAGFMGSDQAWIRYKLGPCEAGWTKQDGVQPWSEIRGDNRWLYDPPPLTRIIFFHGEEKPEHVFPPRDARCQHCKRPAEVNWPYKVVRESTPALSHQWVERFYR